MSDLGRMLIVMGVVIAVAGVVLLLAGRVSGIGRLPGDIYVERGNWSLAIAQMEHVLQEDPNYFWGWRNVAEWRHRLGDRAGYLAAAEEMAV